MKENEKEFMAKVMKRVFMLLDSTQKGDYPLALNIGLGRSSIQSWRNNKSNASAYALTQIADYFNVSVDYLLGREIPATVTQPKETNNNSMRIVLSLLTKHMAIKNISERQLEKEIDLTLSSIYAWRMGKAKPSIDALIKIADYFNVSLDYLVGRETPATNTQPQQTAVNNVTTDPLLNRIVNLDELQRAKVEAYLDGLQATKTTSITRQLVSEAVNTKTETKQTNKNKSNQKLA